MPKYKVSVSKSQKKYSIVLNALSETEARKKVHGEGYSILNVLEINEDIINGHKFFFEAVDKNGSTKKGKVVAEDPFKVYVKLKEGLKYRVKFLYSEGNQNISEGEKMDLVRNLEEQYQLYIKNGKKYQTEKQKKKEYKESKKSLDNFYLKKELDETYRLIDFVLIKLKNILEKSEETEITAERKLKLETLYNAIIKVKKTTNINKLKEVGELALKKVGEIELEVLEKYKDGNSKKLLDETNGLLKKLGSKEHFIEKDKDISYMTKKILTDITDKFKKLKKPKKVTKDEIDKESLSYWKTELLINKYQERKTANTKEIFLGFYLFLLPFGSNKEKKENLLLKRKVISQNITILKAKKTGKLVSYTKLIKGYHGVVDSIIYLLKLLNEYILFVVYLFSLLFCSYIFLSKLGIVTSLLNINGIFLFIYIIFASVFIFFTRGLMTLAINIALFAFLFIFGVVNF